MAGTGTGSDSVDDRVKARAKAAQMILESDPCMWCGGYHDRACPRIKRVKFHIDGTIPDWRRNVEEVEFWPDESWIDSGVVWPNELQAIVDERTIVNDSSEP